ncbi:hypothetical protein SO802_034514 [Lithocarpus litseifolius]|uniref:Uncharacterized protein n=1 Tax=Lithocarpus litseifolius TaxID=425828 RepID=A0AAW2BJ34_9ROSI
MNCVNFKIPYDYIVSIKNVTAEQEHLKMKENTYSMAAANVGQINHAEPGPIDGSVLTQQLNHRSEVIWNGQDPGSLTCRSRNEEFSN